MTVVYTLTPKLRKNFKKPFGILLRGTTSETMKQLKSIVTEEKPPIVVSVGDKVSRNLHKQGIKHELAITDNRSLRRSVQPSRFQAKVFHVKNPQGTITEEAIATVQKVLQSTGDSHIIVEGEEDLLTLVVILYAPDDSLVVYGQPYEGIVVVKVTKEKKEQAKQLLAAMSCSKS